MAVTSIAAIGAGVAIYGAIQNDKQTKRANQATDAQNAMNAKNVKELKDRKFNEDALQGGKARRERLKGGSYNSPYSAKGGTVLTGPLGVTGNQSTGLKTILGG